MKNFKKSFSIIYKNSKTPQVPSTLWLAYIVIGTQMYIVQLKESGMTCLKRWLESLSKKKSCFICFLLFYSDEEMVVKSRREYYDKIRSAILNAFFCLYNIFSELGTFGIFEFSEKAQAKGQGPLSTNYCFLFSASHS